MTAGLRWRWPGDDGVPAVARRCPGGVRAPPRMNVTAAVRIGWVSGAIAPRRAAPRSRMGFRAVACVATWVLCRACHPRGILQTSQWRRAGQRLEDRQSRMELPAVFTQKTQDCTWHTVH